MFAFFKKLHRAYFEGPDWIKIPDLLISGKHKSPTLLFVSWCYGWYIRLLSIPGRMLVVVSPLIIGYTLLSVRTPIRLLAFTIISVMLIDFFVGMIFRPRLKIRRQVPERARVGSDVIITYAIHNKSVVPALDVCMDSYLREKGLIFDPAPAAVNMIRKKSDISLKTSVYAKRRGLYTLHRPIADSGFPLGMFKWSCRDGFQQKLHIYPAFHTLLDLELPVGKRFQKEGTSRVAKVGESLDFAGCRDFRSGDDPRHIHWQSSARSNQLIVKEYQEEYLSRVAVIVDTNVKPQKFDVRRALTLKPEYPALEAAVSITAALADFLARGDFVIDFFAAGPEIYHFQGGRSLSCLDNILDILACIEPSKEKKLDDVTPIILNEVRSIGSAVVIVLDWDEERRKFVQTLRNNGVAVKILLVMEGTEVAVPEDVRILEPSDILRGGVKRL